MHACIVLIDPLDHLEAGIAQCGCDEARIVGRIGQGNGMGIFAVADDQRHAFGVRRGSLGAKRGDEKQDKPAHKDGKRFHGPALRPDGRTIDACAC
jgi:hypothetical protein